MKKIGGVLLFAVAFLFSPSTSFSQPDVVVAAKDMQRDLQEKYLDISIALLKAGKDSSLEQSLYMMSRQIILVEISNNSPEVVLVNPNYFTLVSSAKRSYSYSPETHAFKRKVPFVGYSEITSVEVQPGTMTEGFLVFDQAKKDETPVTLIFKNGKQNIRVKVKRWPMP